MNEVTGESSKTRSGSNHSEPIETWPPGTEVGRVKAHVSDAGGGKRTLLMARATQIARAAINKQS